VTNVEAVISFPAYNWGLVFILRSFPGRVLAGAPVGGVPITQMVA
jgi:hypothetical protein